MDINDLEGNLKEVADLVADHLLPQQMAAFLLCYLAVIGARIGEPLHIYLFGPTASGKDLIPYLLDLIFAPTSGPAEISCSKEPSCDNTSGTSKDNLWLVRVDDMSRRFAAHYDGFKGDTGITVIAGEHASGKSRMFLRELKSNGRYHVGIYDNHRRKAELLATGSEKLSTIEILSEETYRLLAVDDKNRGFACHLPPLGEEGLRKALERKLSEKLDPTPEQPWKRLRELADAAVKRMNPSESKA